MLLQHPGHIQKVSILLVGKADMGDDREWTGGQSCHFEVLQRPPLALPEYFACIDRI